MKTIESMFSNANADNVFDTSLENIECHDYIYIGPHHIVS
jgi:hypothetical protein